MAPCSVVPNHARVTNPSLDVRRQVKAARSQRGWTQRELAAAAKVSRGSVQSLENGMRLDEKTEAKIEVALGWPVGRLDQYRSGASSDERAASSAPPPRIDAATGTVGDLRRELAYFHRRFRDNPADYDRLLDLLDLYAELSSRSASTQGGVQIDAQS